MTLELNHLLSQAESSPSVEEDSSLKYDPDCTLIDRLLGEPVIAVDTEGHKGDYRDGRAWGTGISVGGYEGSEYYSVNHAEVNCDPTVKPQLAALVKSREAVAFHNAKHDLVALKTIGIDYDGRFYDTMLMAHWLDENIWNKGLDAVSKLYLNDDGKKVDDKFKYAIKAYGWGGVHPKLMQEYAAYDADLTYRLFRYLYPKFKEEGYDDGLWDIEQEFIRLIIGMESSGILIDPDFCKIQTVCANLRMTEIEDDLGFNPASPIQLGDFLINDLGLPVVRKTPKGKPSFDKKAMEEYEQMLVLKSDERAELVLEYRGWQKARGYYEAYLRLVSPNDGRLRPNFNLHRAVTGRLSCSDPNLQQIPRVSSKPWNGGLKKAFVAKSGFRLWEADYANLELRIAAAYAKEQSLLEAFDEDRDVFTEISEGLHLVRQQTKVYMYMTLYGAGYKKIGSILNFDDNESERVRRQFYRTYPNFTKVMQRATDIAKQNRYVELWSGRRRHFNRGNNEYYKAFNAVIQGGAADIVKRTMLRLRSICNDECKMLLQIHDSIVFEIREGKEEHYHSLIKQIMEDVQPDFGVKFAVKVKEWGSE